mmetsp:Transcript_41495/g.66718  ORF Transcript_41495/g.66718 Transcript_41495/m.66718 type:complete len:80 (+) Transcript_41495:123-362(+)
MGTVPLSVCVPSDDTRQDNSSSRSRSNLRNPKERVCVIHSRPSTPEDGVQPPREAPIGSGFLVGKNPGLGMDESPKDGR